MKKSSSRKRMDFPARRVGRSHRTTEKKTGRWSFNLATESLFALGSGEAVWRVAYRSSDGDLRFLPH